MAPLKLVNNTGQSSEANLCYVNSTLQLLNTIPEIKELFVSKKYKKNFPGRLPISDELSRIFRTDGEFITSAAQLRILVGTSSGRNHFCEGSQEDLSEFLRALLLELEKELSLVSQEAMRILNKFWGKEQKTRRYLTTREGFCDICKQFPNAETENFNIMKLYPMQTQNVLTLDSLIQNRYTEGTESIQMRCSNCPNSKTRDCAQKTNIMDSPDYLFVQLWRFSHFGGSKIDTVVYPGDEIILPNGDKFMLLAIADHLGALIDNGHYEASINHEDNWIRCNDDKLSKSNKDAIINKHNYVLLYYKVDKTSEFVPTEFWEQVYPSQAAPGGLHYKMDTVTLKNYAKKLLPTSNKLPTKTHPGQETPLNGGNESNSKCDTEPAKSNYEDANLTPNENDFSMKNCRVPMNKIAPSLSNRIKDTIQKPIAQTVKSPRVVPRVNISKIEPKPSARKRKQETKGATRCLSCHKDFVNLNLHISKSFSCQNMYKIDDKIKESCGGDNPENNPEQPPTKVTKTTDPKLKTCCAGCNKFFVYIWSHLSRSTLCQKQYDMAEMENKHQAILKEKDKQRHQKHRKSLSKSKKSEYNENERQRMRKTRESRSDVKHCENNENDKQRKRKTRESRSDATHREDNENDKQRMKKTRESRSDVKHCEDNENNKQRMRKTRESRSDVKHCEDNENDRQRKRKTRESRSDVKHCEDNENDRQRKRKTRESRSDVKHCEDNENNKQRMRKTRESRSDVKHCEDNENDRQRMEKARKSLNQAEKARAREMNQINQRKFRAKQLLENPIEYRFSVAQNKANSRNNQTKTEEDRRKLFLRSVKYGPIYGCVSCHRLCFDNGVISLTANFDEDLEECHPGIFNKAIGSLTHVKPVHGKYHLCFTCKKYIFKGKVPPISHKNNLETFDTTDFSELLLSELEQCLIARNLLFMKMHQLPKSRMAGVKDRLVNVPIHESDVINTVKSLPRTPQEAGIIPVKLKRKIEYKNTHSQEYVSVPKIKAALKTLKSLGHKYYQFLDELEVDNYDSRCKDLDKDELEFLFGSTESENNTLVENLMDEIMNDVEEPTEKDIKDYLENDSVAKFQFDYNRNTYFSNDIPEINVNESSESGISVAPGEGKIPKDILQDKDWDMRAFPVLDPEGKNSLNCDREVKLSAQQFFQQRIFNINRRFANSASFIFAAVQYIENKQLTGNINIAFNRGRAIRTEDGGTAFTLDDPYSVLDNIKNTPRYLKKKKNEFIAKLENHGPFQFFFTLSCADMRYEENFTSLLQDHKIEYKVINDKEECWIDGMELQDFLKVNENKHEFIRQNILTATRNFDHRVKNFIKIIVMSKFNEMHVEFYNYRVEFQMRGAGHIHGVLWIDFDEFLQDERNKQFSNLKEAFEAMGNEMILDEKQEETITRFADKFITCTLKDPTTRDIVQEVNIHHHTRSCRKHNCPVCRFLFPRFPTNETLISVPAKIRYKDETKKSEMISKAKSSLKKVKDVLVDDESMKELEAAFPVDMNRANDEKYLNDVQEKRLFALLLKSNIADILEVEENVLLPESQRAIHFKKDLIQKYKEMLKISTGGYKIVHKRDIDEIFVNNYNKEWIKCWNANMDIQLTLDHFAIITYITDYMLKDDTGTMEFIKKAIKDTENKQLRERLKIVKNTFLTHRQIGEAEAYYKLFPSFHLSGSNCATQFIHTGFRKNRSVFLKSLSETEAKRMPAEKVITLTDKPGKFFAKAESIEDRYDNRHPDLQRISLSQFSKRMTKSGKTNLDEDCELFEKGTDVVIAEESDLDKAVKQTTNAIKEDFIIDFQKQNCNKVQLKKSYTYDRVTMRLRKPLVLRFHKFKQTTDPHQFYFSQLRLYHPHLITDLNEWEDSFEKCLAAYNEHKNSIEYVKSKVMSYQEKVENAQTQAQEEFDNCMGDILDSMKEQQEADCIDEGFHDSEKFSAFDPDGVVEDTTSVNTENDSFFKKIELDSLDFLSSETRKLDPDQRSVIDLGVSFAQDIRKSSSKYSSQPTPPLLVVHGGAGCGKSFVINLMTQWQERIFRSSGDDPSQPYILKCAFTGTAASIIQGQTLHHAFSFSFGNDFYSLNDKTRDERRRTLKNLKVLVIDEFSMVKSDMLYQLDLRLKELKENYEAPFGGVAVFFFGDLLQLRPTAAKYIFDEPRNQQFQISHAIEPLWNLFKVINLRYNHRQGNDKTYADLLNRMRIGETTKQDIELLKTRVLAEDDPRVPIEAIFLSAVNEDVNKINEQRLELVSSPLLTIKAVVSHKTLRKHKPSVTNAGNIKNTPLQSILKLKVGARVMLTYNLNTSDGLTNGALGEIFDYDIRDGRIQRLFVKFYDENIGKERRKQFPSFLKRFPDGKVTPIDKLEFSYSESRKAYSASAQAIALQFPLKLAWAITAHKIQGQTIAKPLKLVVDMSRVFEAAQGYVMLSRVQELEQLIIINAVNEEKIYPSSQALLELDKMNFKALNRIRENIPSGFKLISLNIRSLKKHLSDLIGEPSIKGSHVILVQQTCLGIGDNILKYQIQGYLSHFNSSGDGKGIALYHGEDFKPIGDIKKENYQISKLQSDKLDIICVYRSTDLVRSNQLKFLADLREFIVANKKILILGDFNFNASCPRQRFILSELENWNFSQIIQDPTHVQGGVIDHCYISNVPISSITLSQKSVYYTDHDIIEVKIKDI